MTEAKVLGEIEKLKQLMFGMKQDIDFIKEVFDDKYLSEDDKAAIDNALLEEKSGKLKSMNNIFK